MKRFDHALVPAHIGSLRSVTSLHYGTPGRGEKAYLQASLHADELPGMLVMHHLMQSLAEAEAAGRVVGEIVLVPVANPIGLAQGLLHGRIGRFEAASGENFNRGYPDYPRDGDAVGRGAARPRRRRQPRALAGRRCASTSTVSSRAPSSRACAGRCRRSLSTPTSCSTCIATSTRLLHL